MTAFSAIGGVRMVVWASASALGLVGVIAYATPLNAMCFRRALYRSLGVSK
jgi:hypothetical protein